MMKITIEKMTKAMNGKLLTGNPEDFITGVSTDSRKVNPGEVFFPLIGEQHDAHDFIAQVLERGCRTIVVSRDDIPSGTAGLNLIKVADTTKALQDLAAYYLSLFSIRKIAVTGSTGKTTTKEMLYWIFSEKFKTVRNLGNLNNHIGLPLTIFTLEEDTEAGIFEMGMSEFGEIDLLAQLVQPDVAVITNIGTSHIENLGSRENILKAKLEITNYFDEDSILIVNRDNDLLSQVNDTGKYKRITTGETNGSDYKISDINDYGEEGISFTLEHDHNVQNFRLFVPGRHNACNGALAVAAAVNSGITMAEAAEGLKKLTITDKRLNIQEKRGIKIIDDTYNASPDSMKAAIDVLTAAKGCRKIAVLGDMFELGENSAQYHREVGEHAAGAAVDLLLTVGDMGQFIAEGAITKMGKNRVIHYVSKELLIDSIGSMISSGDVILLKGSRGMAMDQVVKKIMEME